MEKQAEVKLPRAVIIGLVKYADTGCTLAVAIDSFDGRKVRRYIINDKTIIWSEEIIDND